jgi:hypothetical protein
MTTRLKSLIVSLAIIQILLLVSLVYMQFLIADRLELLENMIGQVGVEMSYQ